MPDAIMLELNEENLLNIQTEQLDNHTARFTVEVEQERLDLAKRNAARKIAKQVRIPGFRKGKAPYHILIQNGLESQILNDAIENLSQDIYRDTLEQSDISPYGPGAFEVFKLE
jgi:trigger factor